MEVHPNMLEICNVALHNNNPLHQANAIHTTQVLQSINTMQSEPALWEVDPSQNPNQILQSPIKFIQSWVPHSIQQVQQDFSAA